MSAEALLCLRCAVVLLPAAVLFGLWGHSRHVEAPLVERMKDGEQ